MIGMFFRSGNVRDPLMILFLAWAAVSTLWAAGMALFGKVRLVREGPTFTVFSGIGPIGVRRVYRWEDLTTVQERPIQSADSASHEIILAGGQRAVFGKEVTDEQRYFLREVLRIELTRGR